MEPPDVLTILHESLQKVFAEMTRSDSENLANFFLFPLEHVKAIINSPSHSKNLLVELKNKGIIQSALTDELCENLGALNILTGRNWKPPDTMEITSSISGKGGLLQFPNRGIKLVFPPNSVTEEHNIQVKIIPPSLLYGPDTSNSVVLQLLPNGLQLKREVSLTFTHCLTYTNEEKVKAKIYVSHHGEGQIPCWEERPLSPYIFHRSKCTVRLLDFCWLKVKIDDTEVEAKNLVVFAAKKILRNKQIAKVEIGYYEDIPERGEPNILKLNPDIKPEQSLLLKFIKEGKQPLSISFNGTVPKDTWYTVQGKAKVEIPWQSIALSEERLVQFVLRRRKNMDSFCKFSAQQGNHNPINFVVELEGDQSTGEIADSTVHDCILEHLARELTSEWEILARYLNTSDVDLYNIKENNPWSMKSAKYFMLHQWKRRYGAGATCSVLATALDKAGRRDLREYVESQVEQQEDKSGDVSSKGKAPGPPSVKQPSTPASDLVVTTATIQDLSDKFCDEWLIVGSKLGIGEPKLQTIDTDNTTAQEKVYQMLLTWKQSKQNEATCRVLGEALQSAGRKDLQEYLYQQGVEQQEDKSSDGSSKGKLNYPWLKSSLTVLLSKNDCHQLARHVALSKYQLDAIINSDSSAKDLLDVLEERGVIHPSNVSRLLEAIKILKINQTALSMLERYQRSRGDETSYGRFLAGLSSHLTLSLPRKLCDYFEFTNKKKKAVITSKTPGISFLQTLEDMGVIHPLDVGKLVTPLKQYQLVQAVAKVQEYQTLVDERSELTKPIHTLEGKQALFIECLRKKTKSWYETMTPLPWKKSCKWMTSELFIACGLVLTNSKAKMKTTNVDPKCKLQYTDILTHERLKSATRIIIEGDPGSGKTMLSSQLAYDWSIGKSSDARMVVFLPLKSVNGMTIIEAIEQFYIPKGKPLNEDDIKAILDQASDENKTCIVLDGLEEYNGRTKDGELSEVEKVMRKEKFPNCTVVLTSRSNFVHGLPQCPMLKLGRFGEEERDQYIANIIPDDRERQQKVKRNIETFALLNDLCSIPLLFVYIVHNIEHLGQIDKPKGQLDSVGPFMEVMVKTLLSLCRSEGSESEIISTRLSEIAFNGLCEGYQQLMWPKSFLDENVSNVKDWIESGILVVEEGETNREKEHQKKREAVDEGVATTDEKISLDDERRKGESTSEATMIGEGQDDILSSDGESLRDRESSTNNKPSETEKPFTERKTSTDPQNLSLQVKFLHKVIQEWFAAKHFSSMLQRSKGKNRHRLFLDRHLPLINPADLHYVLRFTSYLCTENSYLITEHLHSCYKSSKGVVPEYILNCIFLCFIECKSSVGKKKMENTVRQVCENIVTIRGEDSRLLQQSKVSMLTYESNSEICIGTLRLVDLVVGVTKETLTFNSNITLEFLPTLKVIEVSQWDMRLKEEDFEELIKFITNCKLLNNAFLNFPSPPPLLTDKKLLSSMKKNLTIEWIIGERVIHTLDKESGEWPMQFRSIPHQTTDQVLSKSLRVMLMINKKGGRLDIPDTGVSLEIPSGALEGEQFIRMIIIPPHLESESLTFASNSSLVVELLPSNLNLLKPAKLTIPHCLVLKKGCEWKAKIYRSHHKEGSKPQWEEQSSTPYKLGEQNCVIDIQRFSWEKFEVDGQIVEAKNIIMYAAGRRGTTDTIYLDFGYYLNLATFEEVPKRNNASLLHEQPTVFKKEGNSLNISLEKFEPMNWTCSEGNNPQEILYSDVAISPWYFCTFVLKKTETKGTDACTCYCKAGQASNLQNFIFQLKAPDPSSVKQPSTSETQEAVRVERFTAGIEAPDLVVTTDTIEYLSENLCDEWRNVGRKLGIKKPKLQAIDIDKKKSTGKSS